MLENDADPTEPKRGWQHRASRCLEVQHLRRDVCTLTDPNQALLRCSGALASAALTVLPTSRATRIDPQLFRVVVVQTPLSPTSVDLAHLPMWAAFLTCVATIAQRVRGLGLGNPRFSSGAGGKLRCAGGRRTALGCDFFGVQNFFLDTKDKSDFLGHKNDFFGIQNDFFGIQKFILEIFGGQRGLINCRIVLDIFGRSKAASGVQLSVNQRNQPKQKSTHDRKAAQTTKSTKQQPHRKKHRKDQQKQQKKQQEQHKTTTAKVAQTVQTAKQQRHEGPEGGAPKVSWCSHLRLLVEF